jgi:flagellar biosynthesis protein FlhF
MTEAMQMVREALGEDAIIIATREDGNSVQVTAALDDTYVPVTPRSRLRDEDFEPHGSHDQTGRDEWLQYDDEDEMDGNFSEALLECLLRHSVPEDILDQILSHAGMMPVDDPRLALMGSFDHMFDFVPLSTGSVKKALMFVGPPGAGKTMVVAKQAARLVMNDKTVTVITSDTSRAGGIEQLEAFTKLLKLDLHKADNPMQITKFLTSLPKTDQILIDTAGYNPFDPRDMKLLSSLIASGDIEPILVLPAAMDADESGEMARVFSTLGARRFIPSRVDIARRLGGLLTASHIGGLAFADMSATSSVVDGLSPSSARDLAYRLLPELNTKTEISDQNSTSPSPSLPKSAKRNIG